MAKNTIFSPKIAIFFNPRLYFDLQGDQNEIYFFQSDFKLLCLKKIVNVPKRAIFSILHFFGILNHAFIFNGKNTLISCFNGKKLWNLMQLIKCPIIVVTMNP